MVMRNRFRFAEHRPVKVKGLEKAITPAEKEACITQAINDGSVTGSEITYLSNYLNTAQKIYFENNLLPRIKELEDIVNEGKGT